MGAQASSMVHASIDPNGILWVAGVVDSDLSPKIKGLYSLLRQSHKMYTEALDLDMSDSKVRARLAILVDTSCDLKKALPRGTTFYNTDRFYAKQEVQWTIRRFEKSLVTIGKKFDNILASIKALPQSRMLATRFQTLTGHPPFTSSFTDPLKWQYNDAVKKLTATMNTIPTGPLPEELAKLIINVNDKKEAVRVSLLLPEVPTTPLEVP
jgi:hypothetical protein